MPSLAELAMRARKGEKVSGGTEVASAERGTEVYRENQRGTVQSRNTVGSVGKVAPDAPEGLNERLKRQRAAKAYSGGLAGK